MKKLFSLFAVVMMAVMSLNLNTLTVAAAEPTTYYVKYDAERGWIYQQNTEWNEYITAREIYYMTLDIKDGDCLIVEGSSDCTEITLNVSLSNLTVLANQTCKITANGITDCYLLTGATANITSDVTNAYLYDYVTCNFFKNCDNLKITYTNRDSIAVNVVGTCKDFLLYEEAYNRETIHVYNFTKSLSYNDGYLRNKESEYSTTPSASTPAAKPAPSAPVADDNEYDDVPKTGETNLYFLAFVLAGVCLLGSYSLKKRV